MKMETYINLSFGPLDTVGLGLRMSFGGSMQVGRHLVPVTSRIFLCFVF
jgi:hypothetical protein